MTSWGLHSFHSLTRVTPKENVYKGFEVFEALSFIKRGGIEVDILYNAANEYQKLKDTIYRIVVGRKGQSHVIMLHFPPETFFHLAGLQHLTDITFPSKNKERIFKEIINKRLTIEDIEKSIFYRPWFIEERLCNLKFLECMLDSNSNAYMINSKRYITYTKIKADYLCERKLDANILYLFLVIERGHAKFPNECRGCSFFSKHNYDYTIGASKTTTLLIEKITPDGVRELFRNPAYKEPVHDVA